MSILVQVDAAILVVSATEGVQSYTETIWQLLKQYRIPTIVFLNKCDRPNVDMARCLNSIQSLDHGCLMVDACNGGAALHLPDKFFDVFALLDKTLLDALVQLSLKRQYSEKTKARIYKVIHGKQGRRLTSLKITGGSLQVKDAVFYPGQKSNGSKIDQLFRLDGENAQFIP